jgi:hypothetical protein
MTLSRLFLVLYLSFAAACGGRQSGGDHACDDEHCDCRRHGGHGR